MANTATSYTLHPKRGPETLEAEIGRAYVAALSSGARIVAATVELEGKPRLSITTGGVSQQQRGEIFVQSAVPTPAATEQAHRADIAKAEEMLRQAGGNVIDMHMVPTNIDGRGVTDVTYVVAQRNLPPSNPCAQSAEELFREIMERS